MEEYDEAPGYQAHPGWVKGNPLNNSIYIERCIEVYPEWAEVLSAAEHYLETTLPGSNIVQVKAKFGELRFYWRPPEGADEALVRTARGVIGEIEAQAQIL